jgi:hypothetical protein
MEQNDVPWSKVTMPFEMALRILRLNNLAAHVELELGCGGITSVFCWFPTAPSHFKKLILVQWVDTQRIHLYSFYKTSRLYLASTLVLSKHSPNNSIGKPGPKQVTHSFFCDFPTCIHRTLDQYVSATRPQSHPWFYKAVTKFSLYNDPIFGYWVINCFFHSILIFFTFSCTYWRRNILVEMERFDNWAMERF